MTHSIFRNRRRLWLCRMAEYCPTTFEHRGRSGRATMTDLSGHGAQFTMDTADGNVRLSPGSQLELRIKTPYGSSLSAAVVRWAELRDGLCRWGVEFTRIPLDEHDPIRCLMESAI